ncbi:MAG: hypothetical protein ABSE92_05640 [Terriglobales bacterium]|jgi:hypothetical protein
MNRGSLLALLIGAMTVGLVIIGTIWPVHTAQAMAGTGYSFNGSSGPQSAVTNLLAQVGSRDWNAAYGRLANRSEFSEADFIRDLNGGYPSLRTYATLADFSIQPLHILDNEGNFRVNLRWSSVVGVFQESRDLRVTKENGQWEVVWPIVAEQRVPPQVIPVNYLRWDVIYRGAGDDWAAQNVESPHVRIIDMRPIDRGNGVSILGEILNEDTVPAFVTVKSTLIGKNNQLLGTEDSFDKISHILLPKQVSPFRIDFPNVALSQVDSVKMQPSSSLIAASADPVIEIENQKISGAPNSSLTGELRNESGQIVNITHVIGTFYDNRGQLLWVGDSYENRALLPNLPAPFSVNVPVDIADKVATFRVVTSSYSSSTL